MKTDIRSLVAFPLLEVGPAMIREQKVSAAYKLSLADGSIEENELVYSFGEKIFDPGRPEDQNLASMMISQVALNYGLFCEEISFDGLFDDTDRRFILDMMENTSREIFVNKFLFHNEFLTEDYRHLEAKKQKRYTAARITFKNTDYENSKLKWGFRETSRDNYTILSSGGKDSLLSYGLIREMGRQAQPVFINESGRHWFTALNAYRYLEKHEPNTARVWCNSDRIFNWMLRQMPFIREDFTKVRADIYPVRLWTVAVFLFGVLPVAFKRGSGRILIGDEYDTTIRSNHQGITHYNSLYDQSRYFDNYLTRYYLKKGWNLQQFSLLRSMSELLIMKVLVKKYPRLQEQQVSCHAAHEEKGRIYPCGKCEKCRRIVGMLTALDEDPSRCGYSEKQVKDCLHALSGKPVKQISSDAAHLYHLLMEKKALEKNPYTERMARSHEHIMKLRFDQEKSMMRDLPADIRKPLFELLLEQAGSAVHMANRKWEPFDVMSSKEISLPYPFGFPGHDQGLSRSEGHFLWEQMTWQEIEERLTKVDTAILPCGSIEQHGPHLPVDVDYYDVVYLATKVAEACGDPKPFVLPGIPYGVSYHHDDFKGTLSVTNDALARFIYDIGISLARNGIRKLIILNGHGDNAPTLNFAAQMINRDAHIFVCVESGETSDKDLDAMVDTRNDIHAGEAETSTTLALRPHLVKMDRAGDATQEFGSRYLDFSSTRGVPWYVRTMKISTSGIMGNPLKATAEKGTRMWEIMIAHLVRFVEDIKNSKLEDLYQKKH